MTTIFLIISGITLVLCGIRMHTLTVQRREYKRLYDEALYLSRNGWKGVDSIWNEPRWKKRDERLTYFHADAVERQRLIDKHSRLNVPLPSDEPRPVSFMEEE